MAFCSCSFSSTDRFSTRSNDLCRQLLAFTKRPANSWVARVCSSPTYQHYQSRLSTNVREWPRCSRRFKWTIRRRVESQQEQFGTLLLRHQSSRSMDLHASVQKLIVVQPSLLISSSEL